MGDPTAYHVYYGVLTGQRKTGEPLLASQMDMLKDPDTLARIGLETGIGFIPFGRHGIQSREVIPAGQRIARARGRGSEAGQRSMAGQQKALIPDKPFFVYFAPAATHAPHHVPQPMTVEGIQQQPIEGVSMLYSFNDAKAADRHETQYFEMFGNRGIYHEGWTAVTRHKTPWLLVGGNGAGIRRPPLRELDRQREQSRRDGAPVGATHVAPTGVSVGVGRSLGLAQHRCVFVAHHGRESELAEDARDVLCHVRTVGPVADVLREHFFLPVRRDDTCPDCHTRH